MHSIPMRWCVLSVQEYEKCMDLKTVVDKVAEKVINMNVTFSCVNGTDAEDCMMKIKAGSADLVTLDGGDIKIAGITFTAKACQLLEAVHADIATRQSVFKQNNYYRICLMKEFCKVIKLCWLRMLETKMTFRIPIFVMAQSFLQLCLCPPTLLSMD